MTATTAKGLPAPVRLWVLAVAVTAALGLALLATAVPSTPLLRPLPLAVVAGVALAEVFSVWDLGRPRSCSITVSELFVGIAFAALEPGTALLACAAGSLLTPPLRATVGPLRGIPARSPIVLLHSVAMPVLRWVAGVAVLVIATQAVGQGWGALTALAAVLAIDTAATVVVVHLDTGLPLRETLPDDLVVEYLTPFATGVFGVLLGLALIGQPLAWLVVAALAGAVVGISRAGTRWSRERRRSRVLLDIARSTVRTDRDGDVMVALTDHVADALLARRVEVTDARPGWAELTAPLGAHGWLAVAGRAIPSQGFDHRDQELLAEVATLASVVLDNDSMLHRLADEERLRSTLLAAAAHDLRSPLAITQASLDVLTDSPVGLDPAGRDRMLESASRATHRAGRLVHDLIVLEQQHLTTTGPPPVADAVVVADRVLAALPDHHAARCRLEAAQDVPAVAMSPVLLERVVDNLVGNALKHTPAAGQVVVRVRTAGRARVVIAVDDRGPGVPPEERDRILAPFARAVAAGSGYGLGLHIATEFVRRAEGELVISDRPDGAGASFQVHLRTAGS